MELNTILDCRKSIRSYTGDCISDDILKKILHAANVSPVALGKYDSVHITIIRDKNILSEIENNAASVFNAEGHSFLYGAPELIVVSTNSADNVGYSNAAIIAHDMILSAVNEGVGACHIWGAIVALQTNSSLIKKMEIPEGFTPACAVAIGMSSEPYQKRDFSENRISVNQI